MSESTLYIIVGVVAFIMLLRPAVMCFMPNSSAADWLENCFPDRISDGSDGGDCGGDGGGD